jgi:CCR4-NOT transcription complex subunit 7/8
MDSNNNVSLEKENERNDLSDASTVDTNFDSSPKSSTSEKISFDYDMVSEKSTVIKEVYAENLEEEIKVIKSVINEYNYIGMDTEFPGTVYSLNNLINDFYYKTMEKNVNSLKLIQLGITLTNKNGEYPKNIPYHTWQFNFKYDEKKDLYSEDSLNLLKSTGIDFENLKKNGIDQTKFGAILKDSWLVLNPNIIWVSFHGSYDFAYLLKLLINENLPTTESDYINLLCCYFPNFYDIKSLIKDNDTYFHGGLNKLIYALDIKRKGIKHQAGSDSLATIEAYHKLIEKGSINVKKLKKFKNVLYGIGVGRDNENTIRYMNNTNNVINNSNINNNANLINRNEFNASVLKNMIYIQNQKLQMSKCIYNNYMKCFYPMFFINNSFGIMKNNMMMNQIKMSQGMA